MHKTITATELKNKTSEFLDHVLAGGQPIVVERNGRAVAVLVSFDEYKHLAQLEDSYWIGRAEKAELEGYISPEQSYEMLKEMMESKVSEQTRKFVTEAPPGRKNRATKAPVRPVLPKKKTGKNQ